METICILSLCSKLRFTNTYSSLESGNSAQVVPVSFFCKSNTQKAQNSLQYRVLYQFMLCQYTLSVYSLLHSPPPRVILELGAAVIMQYKFRS